MDQSVYKLVTRDLPPSDTAGLCDIDFVGRHPEPTTRAEGQIVPCYCEYEGTQVLPFWAINDTVFSPTHLPPIYTVNRSGLFFIADESLNQTHFQCLFVTYNTSTHMFESQNSQVGVIYVTEGEFDNNY